MRVTSRAAAAKAEPLRQTDPRGSTKAAVLGHLGSPGSTTGTPQHNPTPQGARCSEMRRQHRTDTMLRQFALQPRPVLLGTVVFWGGGCLF